MLHFSELSYENCGYLLDLSRLRQDVHVAHRARDTKTLDESVSFQLLKVKGHLNHYPVTILFDCGNKEDVVSEWVVQRAKLSTIAQIQSYLDFLLT